MSEKENVYDLILGLVVVFYCCFLCNYCVDIVAKQQIAEQQRKAEPSISDKRQRTYQHKQVDVIVKDKDKEN